MSDSDRDLILGCREGDVAAWRALLDKYERLVFSILIQSLDTLRNALAALPESGAELLIEVADDGAGAEQSLLDEVAYLWSSAKTSIPASASP
jgi:hypothetical protein